MPSGPVDCQTTDGSGAIRHFTIASEQLPATSDVGAPWRVIPDEVRHAANALDRAGGRWQDTLIPPPTLGIKTGLNEAFLVGESEIPTGLRAAVRRAVRGDQVRAWQYASSTTSIVVPHDAHGKALRTLSSALSQHFAPYHRALLARTDLRPREPWWSLFRTDLLSPTGWRVIWADIGRSLRAALLPPGDTSVPLNTCYGVRLHDPVDAHALLALLNAPTTTAWLSLVAEPARGGYHRFLGWTVLSLPIPEWTRAREMLAPIAARARRGDAVTTEALHSATLSAYDVEHHTIAPLLAWTSHGLRLSRAQEADRATRAS
jgi:hypothetical protein